MCSNLKSETGLPVTSVEAVASLCLLFPPLPTHHCQELGDVVQPPMLFSTQLVSGNMPPDVENHSIKGWRQILSCFGQDKGQTTFDLRTSLVLIFGSIQLADKGLSIRKDVLILKVFPAERCSGRQCMQSASEIQQTDLYYSKLLQHEMAQMTPSVCL